MVFRNVLVLLIMSVLIFGIYSASQLKLSSTSLSPEPPEKCPLSAEATRGRVWAHTCKQCHDIAPTTPIHSSGGPNLQNVYMSVAGTAPIPTWVTNLPYPPIAAARDMGIIWNDENLFEYLHNPRAFLIKATGKTFDGPKTYEIGGKTFEMSKPFVEGQYYMVFYIGDESDRRDVIAYLKAIKNHPECD